MLNITQVLTGVVVHRIRDNHAALFAGCGDEHGAATAAGAAEMALGYIGTSDALYHNIEHTAHVILVGLEILRGRQILRNDVDPPAWLDMLIALACHDIGYVRRLCHGDNECVVVSGIRGKKVRMLPGSSDAALMPIHVDRGKYFVAEQFRDLDRTDIQQVQACIERTRFPVPNDRGYLQTGDYPGLVRGADLIGQLSDRRYLRKLPAVFYEFEEIGFNTTTGYKHPGDLLAAYPAFFDKCVAPYLSDSLTYLEATADGREIISQLYSHLDEARRHQVPRCVANVG